jgi:hypothetical protein
VNDNIVKIGIEYIKKSIKREKKKIYSKEQYEKNLFDMLSWAFSDIPQRKFDCSETKPVVGVKVSLCPVCLSKRNTGVIDI